MNSSRGDEEMGLMGNVNWSGINDAKKQAETVLSYDLMRLRRMTEEERIELWNKIKSDQNTFENELAAELSRDLRQHITSKFSLAKLFIATSFHVNREDNPAVDTFNEKEYALVEDFERYNVFDDILSTDDIVGKIARKEDIYDLIMELYRKQYNNLDKILDDPEIQRDLRLAFKDKYKKRLEKILEGVKAYVGKYGPVIVVSQIEKKVWEQIKESEAERARISESLQREMEVLTSRLESLEGVDEKNRILTNELVGLQSTLFVATAEKENLKEKLGSIESERDRLFERYLEFENSITDQIKEIEEKRGELEGRGKELEKAKEEYKQKMEEEKQRLVESELKEVEKLRNDLLTKEQALTEERKSIELKRGEIDERLTQITEALEGKSLRFVTKEDAKLCELNFIARFDTKMQSFPLKIHSPIENKTFEIKSWQSEAHFRTSEADASASEPSNVSSRYIIDEKKHLFFGEKNKKVIIEVISFNHLKEFAEYGFDARRANLAEFLSLITKIIGSAELGKYLHVIGIASPTGWDERAVNEVRSSDFARNYVSRYVSICLVDSVTGEVFYNPADERITKFVEFFRPQFDKERVEKVKRHILGKLAEKDYVVFEDIAAETKAERAVVSKALYDLQGEGKGKTRQIRDVGLVLEAVR